LLPLFLLGLPRLSESRITYKKGRSLQGPETKEHQIYQKVYLVADINLTSFPGLYLYNLLWEYCNYSLQLESRNQAKHISSPNIRRGLHQRLLLLQKEIFNVSFRRISTSSAASLNQLLLGFSFMRAAIAFLTNTSTP